MKRIIPSLALAALLIPLMGTFEPAEAGSRWYAGADFSVGGVHFSLGFNSFDRYRRGPDYFYRTDHRLNHRGYECGSACYIRDNRYYHHRECPLLLYHFRHNHFNPYSAWAALPYGGLRYYPRAYRPWYGDHRTEPRRHYDRYRRDDRYSQREYRRDYDDDSDSDSDRRWRRDRGNRHDDRRGDRDRRYDDRDRDRSERGRAARSRSRSRRDDN